MVGFCGRAGLCLWSFDLSRMKRGRNVVQALDEAWRKLRIFILAEAECVSLTEEERNMLNDLLKRDVLIFIPWMKAFMQKHEPALKKTFEPTSEEELAKAEAYFRLLAPIQLQQVPISTTARDKAFLFLRVFSNLLTELEEE